MQKMILGAVILLVIILCFSICRYVRTKLAGFWNSADGFHFFMINKNTNGTYDVQTATRFLGSKPNVRYAITFSWCRGLEIVFPEGTLSGHMTLDRRTLIWDRFPTWYRQGV